MLVAVLLLLPLTTAASPAASSTVDDPPSTAGRWRLALFSLLRYVVGLLRRDNRDAEVAVDGVVVRRRVESVVEVSPLSDLRVLLLRAVVVGVALVVVAKLGPPGRRSAGRN